MAEKYVVARIHEGKPFDYLHSRDAATGRMMICTNIQGALAFDSADEARDAAGLAMDNDPHGSEYRAEPA